MSRSEKREAVFLLIYQYMLNDTPIEQIAESMTVEFELIATPEVFAEIVAMARSVIDYAAVSDEIISKYSKTRKVERIHKISVAVMRIALYEMNCVDDVPPLVSINEAVELCKKYADKVDSGFVNAILGGYYSEGETNE
jgi:N utilization substance protein B